MKNKDKMLNVVYDIGANLGNFTQKFLADGYKVVAIEPNPSIFEELKKRFEDNENVITINKAVSSDVGDVEFYVPNNIRKHTIATCNKQWFGGRFKDIFDSGYTTINIGTIQIDELIQKHGEPSIIKIDTEGCELNVIKSMTEK